MVDGCVQVDVKSQEAADVWEDDVGGTEYLAGKGASAVDQRMEAILSGNYDSILYSP